VRNSQLIGPSLISVHVLQTRNASRNKILLCIVQYWVYRGLFQESTVTRFRKIGKNALELPLPVYSITYCKGYSGMENSIQILWVDLFVKRVGEGINK
jgi:hypothetical protein